MKHGNKCGWAISISAPSIFWGIVSPFPIIYAHGYRPVTRKNAPYGHRRDVVSRPFYGVTLQLCVGYFRGLLRALLAYCLVLYAWLHDKLVLYCTRSVCLSCFVITVANCLKRWLYFSPTTWSSLCEAQDAAHCYRCFVVSVCLSVCHDCELCQHGWTDRNAVWGADTRGQASQVTATM